MLSWEITYIGVLLILSSIVGVLLLLEYIIDLTVDICLFLSCYNIYLAFRFPKTSSSIISLILCKPALVSTSIILQYFGLAASPIVPVHKHHIFYKHHNIIIESFLLLSGITVTTNITQIIWVQKKLSINWTTVWSRLRLRECNITGRNCAINLVYQTIRIENANIKSCKQIDKLINLD